MRYETPYEDVDAALTDDCTAAKAHGLLAGMLCAGLDGGLESWLTELFGHGPDVLSPDRRRLLTALYEETLNVLNDVSGFAFDLFLPDDETSLAERTNALGQWCQGFLSGLSHGRPDLAWPSEYDEIVRDIFEISRVDTGSSADDDEESYTELTEYVRIGVQLLRQGFPSPDQRAQLNCPD